MRNACVSLATVSTRVERAISSSRERERKREGRTETPLMMATQPSMQQERDARVSSLPVRILAFRLSLERERRVNLSNGSRLRNGVSLGLRTGEREGGGVEEASAQHQQSRRPGCGSGADANRACSSAILSSRERQSVGSVERST
jgi:hypothetical protein